MNKLQAKYESKTEALQEKFYDRVVVLFEDDPGELLNQKRQREPEKTKMEGFANNLAPRLRQLLTKILISLELDDAGNELRPVPERTNEAGNAPRKAIIRKAKSPRFMAGELVTQLNKLFFKHSRRSLQPIINRFIL